MNPDPYDCQACGACCFADTPHYVPVSGDDHERLGPEAAEFTRFDDNWCYMRMHDGRCAALDRTPATGGFCCAVYDRRPDTCRQLEPGSSECQAERLRKLDRADQFAASRSAP